MLRKKGGGIDDCLSSYERTQALGSTPDEPIEPTCISDVDEESFQKPLWRMKALLEKQVRKERFWIIDEGFLLEIGRCIGEMMFAKIMYRAHHMFD